jgi:galactitol-specific phosphotransferase system IIB component
MNPWVHLQTISQNYRAVGMNSSLIAQMEINKIYEKKGHEFIDVFVNLFDSEDKDCVMTINLIAIYKLRGS